MCGIAGLLRHDGGAIDEPLLRRLGRAVAHRGPDAEGTYLGAGVGLASYRFALEDLPGGTQPASFGSCTVAWNGEIFNWRELAREHGLAGVTGDTTLLPRLFAKLGDAALPLLNGQFAIACWDAVRRRLLLARDQAGILPLFYTEDARGVAFASEFRAFRETGLATESDDGALAHFLRMGFFDAPESPSSRVRQIEPGCAVVFENGRARRHRFFKPTLTGDFRGSREDAAALLSEKFRDAVLRRLSDSAEGLFLSGGVDSALIAAALKAGGIDMPSFTVGFQGDGPTRAYHFRDGFERAEEIYGEFDLSDATAASLGRPPTNRVAVGPETLTRDFAAVVRSLDVPCMSISAPPLFFLTGDAACSIRVAHSGGGADELFAGYAHCDPAKYAGAPSVVDRYLELVQVFSPEELSRIGSPLAECAHDLRGRLPERIAEAADVGLGTLPFVLAAERLGPLAHNILQKNDRIGMRMPLEMRYPFLDNEVVALAETLPEEMLTADGEGKLIVKLAAERLGVPPEISRRKKIRLQAPYATYLADVGVAAFFENIIANPPEGPRLYDPKKTVEFLFGPGCDKVWRRPSKILLLATWNLFLKA